MLVGWAKIAGFLNITKETAKSWHKKHGLPVLRGPNNIPITFEELIKSWVCEYDKLKKEKMID